MWSNKSVAPFLLTDFLGSETIHHWISIPFFLIYLSILFGNGTLLFLIQNDHSLHEPMYYFLAMLAGTDLGMTLTTMPTVLGVLMLDQRKIAQAAYFTQSYFIHTLAIVESGVLLAMAYDRFIAIRTPLRYNSILTNSRIMKVGIGVLLRGFVSIVPPILPLYWFPYCHSHVLSHAFCLHQDVMKLACADITFNHVYPVILVALTFFLDALIILFSYILILKTVMVFQIASWTSRFKALNTCGSHICVILMFYAPAFFSFFAHRFGSKTIPHHIHILVANLYVVVPPMLNPIIYGVKTKQIQDRVILLFTPISTCW
uniref:Olfactory receptor n=1 Tax=Equus asinus TaxID=9793 RepID=A0A9L0JQL9_EQUAS